MKGKAFVIPVSGPIREIELTEKVPLKMLQEAVGGYIEAVPAFTHYRGRTCVAFCNENGKLDRLPANVRATAAWWDRREFGDFLVGDVIIITGDAELLEEL
jgi:hypothetical protein